MLIIYIFILAAYFYHGTTVASTSARENSWNEEKNYGSTITRRLLITFFCLSIAPIVSSAWTMKDVVEKTNVNKLQEHITSTIEHRPEVIALFLKNKINLLTTLVSLYSQDFFFNLTNAEKLFLAINAGEDIVDI